MLKNKFKYISECFTKIKNKIQNNYFLMWLFMSCITFICFILPCLIFLVINKNYSLRIDAGFLCIFIPMALSLSALKNKIVFSILSIFITMELIQFGYMFYFGEPINPFSIEMILAEYTEIIDSGMGMNFSFFLFPLIVLVPYGILIYTYKNSSKSRKQYIFPIIFIFILFSYFPKRVLKKSTAINNMLPSKDAVSLYNDLKVFSGFFFNRLPKILKKEIQNGNFYEEYKIESVKINDKINIVIIFGESNNVNKMSLFGFEKKTTPILEKMAQNDKNFVYKKALSSGTITTVSTNMFFNVRREPDNKRQFFRKTTNLFDLAKNNGFKTFYISAQNSGVLNNISTNSIDYITTQENIYYSLNKNGEIFLLDEIKEKEKLFDDKKNFIVIHQRNIHSPYKKNYKKEYEIFEDSDERVKTYYNAMLYNDFVISSIFEYFKNNTKNPTYVFFVSDHGELLGEDGKWGHVILDKRVAETPFIATFYNIEDNKFKNALNELFIPTHYEIGKIIAEKLGYKIININEKNGEFFINFSNIFGEAGYVKIIKDGRNKTITYIE